MRRVHRLRGSSGGKALRLVVGAICLVAISTGASAINQGPAFGMQPLDDLRTGHCFTSLHAGTQVTALDRVPCSQSHRGQVLGFSDLPAGAYSESFIEQHSLDSCGQHLRAVAPYALDDAHSHLYWLEPLRAAWSKGDRRVTCLLVTDDARTTGALVS